MMPGSNTEITRPTQDELFEHAMQQPGASALMAVYAEIESVHVAATSATTLEPVVVITTNTTR